VNALARFHPGPAHYLKQRHALENRLVPSRFVTDAVARGSFENSSAVSESGVTPFPRIESVAGAAFTAGADVWESEVKEETPPKPASASPATIAVPNR
jgi:hypothetical protein